MNALIKVEESHIKQARKYMKGVGNKRSTHCPIALAMQEQLERMIIVSTSFVKIGGIDGCTKLPVAARRMIHEFDEYNSTTPGEFYIVY